MSANNTTFLTWLLVVVMASPVAIATPDLALNADELLEPVALAASPEIGDAGAAGEFGAEGNPVFDRYAVPSLVNSHDNSAEPTVGIYFDPTGPDPLFFKTIWGVGRATWDDEGYAGGPQGPAVNWEDWSRIETASGVFADPILHTDEDLGRTWGGHFRFPTPCADLAYRDHDDANAGVDNGWTPSALVCQASAQDHETVGSGPWSIDVPVPADAVYPHAVYYCAQYPAVSSCSVSYDGGNVFQTPQSQQAGQTGCLGIHGHVRVSPDGYAAIPARNCGSTSGFTLTQNNGVTYTARTLPGAGGLHFDPSISFSRNADDSGNYWTYFAAAQPNRLVVGVSDDYGLSWERGPVDVSSFYTGPNGEKITRTEWADIQAGDHDRAAVSFLGLTYEGSQSHNSCQTNAEANKQVWHYYIGYTFDEGRTWQVTRASDDPVQIGAIYDGGFGTGDDSCRNLLDFNDMDIDSMGRVHIGYADGCPTSCSTAAQSRSDNGVVLRQTTGKGVFAEFDQNVTGIPDVEITSPPDGSTYNQGPMDVSGFAKYEFTNQELTADAGSGYTGLTGNAVDISGAAYGGQSAAGYTCAWTGSGATFADAAACSTTVTYDAAGDYTITLNVDDGESVANDNALVSVTDAQLPETDPSVQGGIRMYNGGVIDGSGLASTGTGVAGDPVPKYVAGDPVSVSARTINGLNPCPAGTSATATLYIFDDGANVVHTQLSSIQFSSGATGDECSFSSGSVQLDAAWEGRYWLTYELVDGATSLFITDNFGNHPSGLKPIDIVGAGVGASAAVADPTGDTSSGSPFADITSIEVVDEANGASVTLGIADISAIEGQFFNFQFQNVNWLACSLFLPWDGAATPAGDSTSFTVNAAASTITLFVEDVDLQGSPAPYAVYATSHTGDCLSETGTNEDRAPDSGTVDANSGGGGGGDDDWLYFNGPMNGDSPTDPQTSGTYMARSLDGYETFSNNPAGGVFPGTVYAASWETNEALVFNGHDLELRWFANVEGTGAAGTAHWDIQLWIDNGDGEWRSTNDAALADNEDVVFFTGGTPYEAPYNAAAGINEFTFTIPDVTHANPAQRLAVVIDGYFIDSNPNNVIHYGSEDYPSGMLVAGGDDNDADGDGVPDISDNCVNTPNPDQANNDGDAEGDACDEDDDNDGVLDVDDACPFTAGTGPDGCPPTGTEHVLLSGNGQSLQLPINDELWSGTLNFSDATGDQVITAEWFDANGNSLDVDQIIVHPNLGGNLPPVAVASGPSTLENGDLGDFDGTASYDPDGTIVSYGWAFGDGNTGTGAEVSHAWNTDGVYTVVLTVTDNNNSVDQDTLTVTVSTTPPPSDPVVDINNPLDGHRFPAGTEVILVEGTVDRGEDVVWPGEMRKEFTTASFDFDTAGACDAMGWSSFVSLGGSSDPDVALFGWHTVDSAAANTAPCSWYHGDDQLGTYPDLQETYIISPEAECFAFTSNAVDARFEIQVAGTSEEDWDFLDIQVSECGANSWTQLNGSSISGTHGDWTSDPPVYETLSGDLTPYIGAGTYQIRVVFNSDEINNDIGFHIDSFSLIEGAMVEAPLEGTVDLYLDGSATPFDSVPVQVYESAPTDNWQSNVDLQGIAGQHYIDAIWVENGDVLDNDTTWFTMNAAPFATISGPTDLRLGESGSFDGSGSTDDVSIFSYSWDFGDETTGSGATVDHAWSAPGTYTVSLTVHDAEGASSTTTHDVEVTANEAPTAVIIGPSELFVDESGDFDGSQSFDNDGTIVSYSWDFGDGSFDSGATTSHVWSSPGNYNVTLTVTDNEGATDSEIHLVTVSEEPNDPPTAIIDGPTELSSGGTFDDGNNGHGNDPGKCDPSNPGKSNKKQCDEDAGTTGPETGTFNGSQSFDNDGTIVSYSWDFGDGNTASGVIVEHAYDEPGIYTVTLTVTDDDGATGVDTHQVIVTEDNLGGDGNNGHGNNVGGCDPSNPGNSPQHVCDGEDDERREN